MGETWPQSLTFWKCHVLHCTSGLGGPILSNPNPEIFLRACLTIADSMVESTRRSLVGQNWPWSCPTPLKMAKFKNFWYKWKTNPGRSKCYFPVHYVPKWCFSWVHGHFRIYSGQKDGKTCIMTKSQISSISAYVYYDIPKRPDIFPNHFKWWLFHQKLVFGPQFTWNKHLGLLMSFFIFIRKGRFSAVFRGVSQLQGQFWATKLCLVDFTI